MRVTKATAASMKAAMLKTYRDNLKVTVTKSGRASRFADIQAQPERVSITKWMKGQITGDWTNARVEKALGQDDGARGGVFVPSVLASEVIPLLSQKSVIKNLPGVGNFPMTTDKVDFGRIDEGPSISWGGEAGTIAEDTSLEFGSATLEAKKAVCLYKMSNELLQNASPGADEIVRNELAKAMALELDNVILEGTGGTQPLGIFYNPRVRSTDLSGNCSVDDLKQAIYQVRLNSSEAQGCIAHPRTSYDLARLKDGEGRYILETLGGGGEGVSGNQVSQRQLLGMQYVDTTTIAITLMPDTDETYLVIADWSELLIGANGPMKIDFSPHVYFTTDQTAVRLTYKVGSLLKHAGAFAVIKGISSPV